MSSQHRPLEPQRPVAVAPGPAAVRFEAPLPPKEASPNGQHGAWTTATRARRVYREAVGWSARAAKPRGWVTPQLARVSLCFGTRRVKGGDEGYRPLDVPNAVSAFKGGFDGIVDAGLLLDDSYRCMELGAVTIDPRLGPGVVVVVEVVAAVGD